MCRRIWQALLLITPAVCLLPTGSTAQSVYGLVTDEILGDPIELVSLEFTSIDGEVAPVIVVTDTQGRFRAPFPGPGFCYVQTNHLRYEPVVYGPIEVRDEAERIELLVELMPRPAAPWGISVEVRGENRRRYLERRGFYRRRSTGQGRYVGSEDLEGRRFRRYGRAGPPSASWVSAPDRGSARATCDA